MNQLFSYSKSTSKKTLGIYFFFIICILIPFYRVRIQFDFRLYVTLLFFINYFIEGNIAIVNNKSVQLFHYLLFYFWLLLTSLFSFNYEYSYLFLNYYFFEFLFFLLVLKYINNYEKLYLLSKVIILGYFFQLFIVFMQFLGFESFYLNKIENLNQNTGMGNQDKVGIRYWGSFGEALSLSTYLTSIGIGFLVFLFEAGINKSKIIIFFFIALFFVYLTGSRSGLAVFVLTFFSYMYLNRRKDLIIYISFLSCIVIAIFSFNMEKLILLNSNLSRFKDLRESDFRYRLWTEGFKIVVDSPLYGSTIGCLNYKLKEYSLLPSFVETINATGHAENAYLTMLFSTGIIGFCLFLYIVLYPFNQIKHYQLILDKENDTKLLKLLKSYKYAYISILFCMMFEPSVGMNFNSTLHFMLLSGVIIAFGGIIKSNLINKKLFIS